jgi:hypothetical protein
MHNSKTPLHHKRWTLRLFEWGVLACVVLILMGVFLRKVRYLQAEAERLSVQATIENMRAAVLLAFVLHKDNETVRIHARPGGNPAALLKEETGLEPDGYIGELENATPQDVLPGQWYYDRGEKALVYRLRSTDGFESPLPDPPHIRICLDKTGADGLGRSPLVLEPCERYKWGKLY